MIYFNFEKNRFHMKMTPLRITCKQKKQTSNLVGIDLFNLSVNKVVRLIYGISWFMHMKSDMSDCIQDV